MENVPMAMLMDGNGPWASAVEFRQDFIKVDGIRNPY